MKSPSRTPVSIVSIPRESSHWKQIVSPVTPEFFTSFSDFLGDCPVPEGWKHFRGRFYSGPDGKFGCFACGVEAVSSNDESSFLCPKRSQYGDMKGFGKAQEKGCFAIIKKKSLNASTNTKKPLASSMQVLLMFQKMLQSSSQVMHSPWKFWAGRNRNSTPNLFLTFVTFCKVVE